MTLRRLIRRAVPVAAIVLLAFCCSRYCFQLMLIQGESMVPAYHNLQPVILDKLRRDYRPGDGIAFWCEGLKSVLVKRVAAGPGDRVVIEGGTLYVNGEISRVYSREGLFDNAGVLAQPVVLGAGEYIVIGDNIAESLDSRDAAVGVVKAESILGRIIGSGQR